MLPGAPRRDVNKEPKCLPGKRPGRARPAPVRPPGRRRLGLKPRARGPPRGQGVGGRPGRQGAEKGARMRTSRLGPGSPGQGGPGGAGGWAVCSPGAPSCCWGAPLAVALAAPHPNTPAPQGQEGDKSTLAGLGPGGYALSFLFMEKRTDPEHRGQTDFDQKMPGICFSSQPVNIQKRREQERSGLALLSFPLRPPGRGDSCSPRRGHPFPERLEGPPFPPGYLLPCWEGGTAPAPAPGTVKHRSPEISCGAGSAFLAF